jgi:hypothetical protein
MTFADFSSHLYPLAVTISPKSSIPQLIQICIVESDARQKASDMPNVRIYRFQYDAMLRDTRSDYRRCIRATGCRRCS